MLLDLNSLKDLSFDYFVFMLFFSLGSSLLTIDVYALFLKRLKLL